MSTTVPPDTPSEHPSPDPSSDGTILFEENDQVIDHVLTVLLLMNVSTVEKVKLWLEYKNVHNMSQLLDLYFDDPENIKSPEYRVGSTKEYLDKWSGVGLTIICKLGEHLIIQREAYAYQPRLV